MDVDERLQCQLATSRRGLVLARQHERVRARALEWLDAHPSGRPDVDAAWRDALLGKTELSAFLEGDSAFEQWTSALPLRVIVSAHPFPDLWRWTVPL
ncbi:MAG: hypothetical protein JNG84_10675 [Archangium sp.]|nr:hypothetical protein [Archangium sp.]